MEDQKDAMQNGKTLWNKLLQGKGGIYFTENKKEEDDVNEISPLTEKHFSFRPEGEKDNTGKYPHLKVETERNRVPLPSISGPSHAENSEGEMLEKERTAKNPGRKHKVQYKSRKRLMDGRKTILVRGSRDLSRGSTGGLPYMFHILYE